MTMYKQLIALAFLFSVSFSISAKEIRDKDQLICAFSEAALCRINEKCIEGSVKIADLPLLVRLNLDKKTIASTHLSGEHRTSTILSVNTSNKNLILQGVQEGSGWSMTIHKENGQMSVSSSLNGEGYIAFGVCTRS